MTLSGKCAIVTGGSRGIGSEVVARLLRDDCFVINLDPARPAAAEGDRAQRWVEGDVTKKDDRGRALAIAENHMGALDVLVNNAGISRPGRIEDDDGDEIAANVIAVNLLGTISMVGDAMPLMKKSRCGASIVNISSIGAHVINPAVHPSYAASKGGQLSLTRYLAAGYAKYGVRCNAVLPGAVRTELWGTLDATTQTLYADLHPLGIGECSDIASLVAFLSSDEAKWLSGAEIVLDGGNLSAGGLAQFSRKVL